MTAAFVPLLLLAPADPPSFVAVGTTDERPAGRVVRLAPAGTAELATPAGIATIRDLISLRLVGTSLPPLPRGPALFSTTGDRIPGTLAGGDARALRFRPAFLTDADPPWAVPLSSIAVVWLARPPADTPPDPDRYPWLADPRRKDLVLLRNGDLARGTLTGFAPDIRLKPDTGAVRTFPLTEPAALAFDPSLARTRKPQGPYTHLVLRDGARLDLASVSIDGDTVRGKALFGTAVEIPLAELVALDVWQGKAAYLSDLKPVKVEQSGFLGPAWPWSADRTVRGEPLRLLTSSGVETFDKGLGIHPRTALTYPLGGKYRRFEAVVGLDAASGGGGRADVRVLVDGKEVSPPELRLLSAGPAVVLRADLTGAKELALVVDFGPTGDVRADVNWGDARLIE
ncbi:MAG TPA: NPCBM/NEW2 domain-containing protein [Gemmataceae bacterium]|nr:NPCBM/NEW2 domain-containing protein [Gemmataceae bacterium]